jgi:hypothetical protein
MKTKPSGEPRCITRSSVDSRGSRALTAPGFTESASKPRRLPGRLGALTVKSTASWAPDQSEPRNTRDSLVRPRSRRCYRISNRLIPGFFAFSRQCPSQALAQQRAHSPRTTRPESAPHPPSPPRTRRRSRTRRPDPPVRPPPANEPRAPRAHPQLFAASDARCWRTARRSA